MAKSADAFRTISEVAEWLDTPAHVLRFWESKFTQIKPVKRAGGRRYYRPADMALIGGIKKLLHDEGMTIKGVQKVLREEGIKHVAALSQPVDGEAPAPEAIESAVVSEPVEQSIPVHEPAADIVEPAAETEIATSEPEESAAETVEEEAEAEDAPSLPAFLTRPAPNSSQETETTSEEPEPVSSPTDSDSFVADTIVDTASDEAEEAQSDEPLASAGEPSSPSPAPMSELPAFLRRPAADAAETEQENTGTDEVSAEDVAERTEESESATTPEDEPEAEAEPEIAARMPLGADIAADPADTDIPATPGALSRILGARRIDKNAARTLRDRLARVAGLDR